MKPLFRMAGLAALLVVCGAQFLRAQQTQAPDWEIFGGYSFSRVSAGAANAFVATFPLQQNSNGWEASLGQNVNRWLGGVADFGGAYANRNVGGLQFNSSAYSFLFGPQFALRTQRISLFGRAMIGGEHALLNFSGSTSPIFSQTKWAYALGGGADIKLTRLVSLRADADFIRTHFPEALAKDFQNNVRVSAGLAFTLGHIE